ncbi:hypothetical protein EV699_111166 [Plasticicumulans lactativorans]|uniref:Methyltransferase family protein n=1 Tax=Plasticicumulans lactativorans TaxID=1133106 RepID=A0A4R2LND6_9GAMM|nr:DUF6231 family protein [Plasticicumulans lactativorans]TCO80965.1 hypothetical protein EV699_111166 [Plasticicumulans lactativorans]
MSDHLQHAALAAWLAETAPASLLVLDPDPATALPADFAARHPACQVLAGDARAPAALARADAAVLSHVLEHLDAATARALLARVRDQLCPACVVLVPLGADWPGHASHWQDTDLLALGLTLRARLRDDAGRPWALFEFAIARYKTVPDWLNARFWAHPERWRP